MNDGDLAAAAQTCTSRRALVRLLGLLGFATPLQPGPQYALPCRARTYETRRGSLLVTVLELRAAVDERTCTRCVHALCDARTADHHLLVLVEPHYRRLVFATGRPGAAVQRAAFEPGRLTRSDVDVLREMVAPPMENGTEVALRLERALDRRRVSDRFFRDISACRAELARAWTGIPSNAAADREALALLLLSRLLFLYFLQRRGLLAGNATFLGDLLRQRARDARPTLYRSVLRLLFFGVLNRLPARRTLAARALGELPYLNGGLFEEHALELRRPHLDLPDTALLHAIRHVLEKYRFTTAPERDGAIVTAIEPEMLGRIFEGLMPGERRSRTGSFYTPSDVVAHLTRTTLASHLANDDDEHAAIAASLATPHCELPPRLAHALHERVMQLRVLDPSCGSGAFLLGALDALVRLRTLTSHECGPAQVTRHEVVANALHGVDILGDAALICSLRLWLALAPACDRIADVQPLPNLDRQVRQGDALVDPFDLTAADPRGVLPLAHRLRLKRITSALLPLAASYASAQPDAKRLLRRRLARLELQLARCWTHALQEQLHAERRELVARAADRDLFGAAASHAVGAQHALRANESRQERLDAMLRDLHGRQQLPFFSFRVHFPHVTEGFDVVLMNPPWVRSHHWPAASRDLLRQSYAVCNGAGWPYAAALTATPAGAGAQVDLALLFIERALHLLADHGTLGTLAPAKLFRSLYAGAARALLLRDTELRRLEDHSLDHRRMFSADAFAALLVARKRGASADDDTPGAVRIRLARRGGDSIEFVARTCDLPLRRGDVHAPWLLAPPDCAAALRAMQAAGMPLGELGLRVRRGAMTAANDVLLLDNVEPRLGDLLHITAEGRRRRATHEGRHYRALVESDCVRPCVRGTDVRAWQVGVRRHVVWSPLNDDAAATLPRRLRRYLQPHATLLRERRATGGALQRLSPDIARPKVVWADVATTLRACALPARSRTRWGALHPTVPLNTVYYIATSDDDDALLLSAFLNSLPLRAFARAIAERAKDAHFRFFAWTVASLPLPHAWQHGPHRDAMLDIARDATAHGGIAAARQTQLDALCASAFALSDAHMTAITRFDRWLEGE